MDINAIATAHGIQAQMVVNALAEAGWDFSQLDRADPTHVDFATRVVTDVAQRVAAAISKRAERDAKIIAARESGMTHAAKLNPAASCTRCDGKGRIRGFSHVEGGRCFACGGAGVRRIRAA